MALRSFSLRLGLLAAAVLLSACATDRHRHTPDFRYDATHPGEGDNAFIGPTNDAVDHLVSQIDRRADVDRPLIVTTPQEISALTRPSAFGMTLGEVVQSRLAKHGYGVIEIKMRDSIQVNGAGELLLSRDVRELAASRNADTAVVGTWSEGQTSIYVTLKAVRLADGVIVGSESFTLRNSSRLPHR